MVVKKFISDAEVKSVYDANECQCDDDDFKALLYYFEQINEYDDLYIKFEMAREAYQKTREKFSIKHGDARDDEIDYDLSPDLFQFYNNKKIPEHLSFKSRDWLGWNEYKNKALKLADLIEEFPELEKYSIQLRDTAQNIHFEFIAGKELKFKSTFLSRWRHDPVSLWRRSLKWQAKWYQALPCILDKYPSHRWLHLTMSIYDCEITELRNTIDLLNNGFKKLLKRNELIKLKNLGWFKSIEVKKNIDETANPLLHAMLLVPSSYFSSNYIKKDKWIELWRSCTNIDYGPNINIYEITNDDNVKVKNNYLIKTVKYITNTNEVANLLKDADWTREYISQVKNLRFIAVGGGIKNLFFNRKNEDNFESLEIKPLIPNDVEQSALVYYSMFDHYDKVKSKDKESGVTAIISDNQNITQADRIFIHHLMFLRYIILLIEKGKEENRISEILIRLDI